MPTYENKSKGPKVLNTTNGPVLLQAGESRDDLELSKEEAASLESSKLLEDSASTGGRSIADLQREIASASGSTAEAGADGLPADDDDEVRQLSGGSAKDLRDTAKEEGVTLEGDDNKADMARKIVAARRNA